MCDLSTRTPHFSHIKVFCRHVCKWIKNESAFFWCFVRGIALPYDFPFYTLVSMNTLTLLLNVSIVESISRIWDILTHFCMFDCTKDHRGPVLCACSWYYLCLISWLLWSENEEGILCLLHVSGLHIWVGDELRIWICVHAQAHTSM